MTASDFPGPAGAPRRRGVAVGRAAARAGASVVLLVVAGCTGPTPAPVAPVDVGSRARNVILISGDGMGAAQREAARLVLGGAAGQLAMDSLPVRGAQLTGPPGDANEGVTDSAAAATAWSTGRRTYNGAVSVDVDRSPLPPFGREAKAAGKVTGLVTTSSVTDASPAAFFATAADRDMEEDIARQYLEDGGPDVILGGGRNLWTARTGTGRDDLVTAARNKGYRYSDTAATLNTDGWGKLLGLYSDEELWKAPADSGERTEAVPTLAALTDRALNTLAASDGGFFLFVEEEGVDEASHANRGAAMIEAIRGLDEAVEVAIRFVERNPGTLLVVTGDHETGGLVVGATSPTDRPGAGDGPFTVAGSDRRFELGWSTAGHTGAATPVTAMGPGSRELKGEWANTRLHDVLTAALLGA